MAKRQNLRLSCLHILYRALVRPPPLWKSNTYSMDCSFKLLSREHQVCGKRFPGSKLQICVTFTLCTLTQCVHWHKRCRPSATKQRKQNAVPALRATERRLWAKLCSLPTQSLLMFCGVPQCDLFSGLEQIETERERPAAAWCSSCTGRKHSAMLPCIIWVLDKQYWHGPCKTELVPAQASYAVVYTFDPVWLCLYSFWF